ncbi:MAG: hypothetical protein HYX24_04085 [Candidatus Aenigmarchaeota archaeon]|nr:hypothetical protein [Candidatus Aenigmarchaeota archaeon]
MLVKKLRDVLFHESFVRLHGCKIAIAVLGMDGGKDMIVFLKVIGQAFRCRAIASSAAFMAERTHLSERALTPLLTGARIMKVSPC